ncbi:MAG: glycerol-3-phosphate dehydrogenase/oxidase [Acidobacteria bacterium]|nr:glycerol-3-phosphate dehydrogenase/oxidase [Acidobacteriota bacterium]
MNRQESFDSLERTFDVLVIGGGATGLGIAVDAVTRGFTTALIEAGDFAQATSSRATKLVHGGVRYLATGQVHLVYEALHERAVMMRNAPHLVKPQAFILPTYTRHELPYFGAGLLAYDLLSGKASMGPTRILGPGKVLDRIPNLQPDRLKGGVLYHDGQFNDARMALVLARTAADHGATVINYARCQRLQHTLGKVTGAVVIDTETGKEYTASARVVFNATGIFTDQLRQMDNPQTPPLLTVSRGTHLVVDASVLGGSAGIMVPKTRDGRVIFAIPWQGRVVIGTTDLPAASPTMEPGHTRDEILFLLETINPFLAKKIGEEDILSVFSGLRPLVTGKEATTSKISREHHIDIAPSGLITVAGGKWTTYRRMAQDALDFATSKGVLPKRLCVTSTTLLHGAETASENDPVRSEYGTDAKVIRELETHNTALAQPIAPGLPYTFAQVAFAARFEMARTLEDILSRRTRSLILDQRAALTAAPQVAALLRQELSQDERWEAQQIQEFTRLANQSYATMLSEVPAPGI